MRQVNSTDFTTHFGEIIDLLREGPINVLRGGKPVGVFLSSDEFAHFQRLDEDYWAARAQVAETCGEEVGHEEAMRMLTERLTREK